MTIADFNLPRRLRRTAGQVARVICPRRESSSNNLCTRRRPMASLVKAKVSTDRACPFPSMTWQV